MSTHPQSEALIDAISDFIAMLPPHERIEILSACCAACFELGAKAAGEIRSSRGANVVPFPLIPRPIPEARQ